MPSSGGLQPLLPHWQNIPTPTFQTTPLGFVAYLRNHGTTNYVHSCSPRSQASNSIHGSSSRRLQTCRWAERGMKGVSKATVPGNVDPASAEVLRHSASKAPPLFRKQPLQPDFFHLTESRTNMKVEVSLFLSGINSYIKEEGMSFGPKFWVQYLLLLPCLRRSARSH